MKLNEFVKDELLKDKYILALSGGVDSIVLLDLIEKNNLLQRIEVVHINHGLREESYHEELNLKRMLDKKGKKLHVRRLNLKGGNGSFETEARNERYKVFKEEAERLNCVGVITGHHGEDLVETMIMRIIRGTGSKGLIGMRPVSFDETTDLKKIAGLYGYKKSEIYSYAKVNGLTFYEDATNKDESITRNNIRRNIIPSIEELNPKYIDSFERLSQQMKENEDYWAFKYKQLKSELIDSYSYNGLIMKKADLVKLHKLELNNFLYYLLVELKGRKNVESKHVDLLINEVYSNRNNEGLNIGKGLVSVNYENAIIILDETIILDNENKLSITIDESFQDIESKKNERANGKRVSKLLNEFKIPHYYRSKDLVKRKDEELFVKIDGCAYPLSKLSLKLNFL